MPVAARGLGPAGLLAVVLGLAMSLSVSAARAESLVMSLSTDQVEVSSNFTGAGIAVFGAIERDAETVSRGDGYDIVVVVRGPSQSVTTRRKERVFGIWLNRTAETFQDVPSFLAVSSSRPLADVATPVLLDRFQLGLSHIQLAADGRAASPDFRDAFVRLKQQAGLYSEATASVAFINPRLFQTTIRVPADVPVGTYLATVYLFGGGALLARTDRLFVISKIGVEQFVFTLSREQALVYGIACVALALFLGWLGGVVFRRD